MCFPDSPENQRYYLKELIEAVEGVPQKITRTFGVEKFEDADLGARADYFMLLNCSSDRHLRTRSYVRDNVGNGEEAGQAFVLTFLKVAIAASRADTRDYLAPVFEALGAAPGLTVERVAYDQTERLKFLREIFHAVVQVCDDIYSDRVEFFFTTVFGRLNADLQELDASLMPEGVPPTFPCSEDFVTTLLVMASNKAQLYWEDTAASRQKFYDHARKVLLLICRACLSPVEYETMMSNTHELTCGGSEESVVGFFVDGNGDALFTTAGLAEVRGLALRDLLRRHIATMPGVDLTE